MTRTTIIGRTKPPGILRRRMAALQTGVLLLVVGLVTTASAAAIGGVSQGYNTTSDNLAPGTLMGLSNDKNSAEPATAGQAYELLGLVADKPLLALNDGNHQVQIVVSGTSTALVSDLNGDIKAGDRITASPIKGVGMKATEAGQIVGTAQGNLAESQTASETVTDKQGKSKTIKVGTIPVQVSVSYYSGESQNSLQNVLPPFVIHAANGVAGQQVSPVRVLIGLLAMLFGFVVVANMLQAAIRSGIIAIGRNPLAKTALQRELVDVCFTALGVLLLTTAVVYVVLKI